MFNLSKLTSKEVYDLILKEDKISNFAEIFLKHEIDGEYLESIITSSYETRKQLLNDIGITNLVKQNNIKRWIERLCIQNKSQSYNTIYQKTQEGTNMFSSNGNIFNFYL